MIESVVLPTISDGKDPRISRVRCWCGAWHFDRDGEYNEYIAFAAQPGDDDLRTLLVDRLEKRIHTFITWGDVAVRKLNALTPSGPCKLERRDVEGPASAVACWCGERHQEVEKEFAVRSLTGRWSDAEIDIARKESSGHGVHFHARLSDCNPYDFTNMPPCKLTMPLDQGAQNAWGTPRLLNVYRSISDLCKVAEVDELSATAGAREGVVRSAVSGDVHITNIDDDHNYDGPCSCPVCLRLNDPDDGCQPNVVVG